MPTTCAFQLRPANWQTTLHTAGFLSAWKRTTVRHHESEVSVYFHYPWSEDDLVEIALPKGYALDSADAPSPFGSGGISEYKPSLSASVDGSLLVYKRTFFFGGQNSVLFPIESYGPLKNYFDTMHKQDNHSVALKQTATN